MIWKRHAQNAYDYDMISFWAVFSPEHLPHGSPSKHLKQECGVLIQHFGPWSARMQVQGACILPLSLYPGPAIQCALEAAVTAVVQQSCSPGGQHPQTKGRLAKGGGCGAGEYLPFSPLSNCPWNTNFGNLNLQTHPTSS